MAAKVEASGKQGRKPGVRYYACGTPKEFCIGALKPECKQKVHMEVAGAKRCTARYLRLQGYTRLSSREWCVGDGPILTLPKGALRAKPGKYDGLIAGIVPRLPAPKVVVEEVLANAR